MVFDLELAWTILPNLLKGTGITLLLIPPTMVLGMLISIPMALAGVSSNPLLVALNWAFTTFFRGAPLLILLYMVYNGLATLSFVRNTFLWTFFKEPFYCAVVGLALNHAGFVTEILRGAFQAVPQSLIDTARALALSKFQIFRKMTMPLAIRLGLSAYLNEVVLLAKGTAVVSAITIVDLFGVANDVVSMTYDPFTPLVMAGAIYWLIVQFILFAFHHIEVYLNRHLDLKL